MNDATLGSAFSAQLFSPATWRNLETRDFSEHPYPGWRPNGSWRLTPDGGLHGIQHGVGGWADRHQDDYVSLADRHLVLGYGSNLNPVKLADLYAGSEVIVLRAAVFDWAAAWCDSRRRQGDVVATLIPVPGRVEVHGVIAVTDEQLEKMNHWEGHPLYYRRQRFTGIVRLENGETASPEVYIGTQEKRPTLLIDGQPALCSEVSYEVVDELVPGDSQT